MDGTQEEAIRTRKMAERKLQRKDYAGAQRIALRAQQIFPELENITRILAVCYVHCASEQKIAGDELDWYGILQIEQTADASLIKKQYRKLALLLHPDKNKYSGAESAFKLIGEAQRVLSDPVQRLRYDTKRRAGVGSKSVFNPQKKTRNSSTGTQRVSQSVTRRHTMPLPTDMNSHQEPRQSTQPRPSSNHNTSFSTCPYCKMRHQVSIPNSCHSCKKPFVSQETYTQTKTRVDQSACGEQDFPSQTGSASCKKPQQNMGGEPVHSPSRHAHPIMNPPKISKNRGHNIMNDKRKRSEISKSSKSFIMDDREEGTLGDKVECGQNIDLCGEGPHKRYIRQKISSFVKMAKDSVTSRNDSQTVPLKSNVCCMNLQAGCGTNLWNSNHDLNQRQANPSCPNVQEIFKSYPSNEDGREEESAPKVECSDCQDVKYNDFDKIRGEKGFTAGQVWALYHPFDAMPRLYATVKAVYRTKFKLRMVWLEPDPYNEVGVEMGNRDFPRTWGEFAEGHSDIMDNLLAFSHQMIWEKDGKNMYKIYPRKGEAWAVFKNWNTNKACNSMKKGACKFQLVEVLSGYVEGRGVSVVYLGKVKGFTSIFCPVDSDEGKTSFEIAPEEMSRFSHKIPSFQMPGKEKKGIPRGSIELDVAAIPPGIEVLSVPDLFRVQTENCDPLSSDSTPITSTGFSSSESHFPNTRDGDSNANENPEAKLHSFEVYKSNEKFQVGQVWAFYGETGLPRHYARIKSIVSSAAFQLEVNRLIPCPDQDGRSKWNDRRMPHGCGKFKLSRAKPEFLCPADFSHHLSTVSRGKMCTFFIFPRHGEVWALYKNWNANMCFSKVRHCEYDIVEVLGCDDLAIEVLLLQRVSGFGSVFKCKVNHQSNITWRIPRTEFLRFSHHIPAFQHANEKKGLQSDLWELDPQAILSSN
uniref:J domain-containing protein n=1 Tax=Kalanchoe fedtschenkoi TaxID=63787 RepID=A0A7N0UNL2_KALFE